jgi:hypothetical protein
VHPDSDVPGWHTWERIIGEDDLTVYGKCSICKEMVKVIVRSIRMHVASHGSEYVTWEWIYDKYVLNAPNPTPFSQLIISNMRYRKPSEENILSPACPDYVEFGPFIPTDDDDASSEQGN